MNYLPELIALVRHPAIQGRRGRWYVGDRCFVSGEIIFLTDKEVYRDEEIEAIWLPPLSDPIQPERGLISMCKGVVTVGRALFKEDSWFVQIRELNDDDTYKRFASYKGPTPEIAVCKAVIAQSKEEK